MSKILVIEDEQNIRTMISYDLRQLGYDVALASDGKVGYHKALSSDFDIIILDVMLPGMDGREIARKLKEQGIRSYILMLSALDDEFDKIRGFEVGADDYMVKPFSPRELSAKIKAILKREKTHMTQENLTYGDITIDYKTYTVYVNQKTLKFTFKEFELLAHFMKHKNQVLSRDQLLSSIWGYQYDGDSRVVDVHVSKLRIKLDTSAHTIETVRGVGYMLK